MKPLLAPLLLLIAGGLWFGLVRQSPAQSAVGTIESKGYVAGTTFTRIPVGANRGFTQPQTQQIAEANAFELRLDGFPKPVRAQFNTVKSRQFEVGQRVRVTYVRRGIPKRVLVTEMVPDSAR
jgi:hypothetical protein